MSDLLGVTIDSLCAALKQRRAPLPYEIGAFVALEVCESLQPGPAAVRASDVRIGDDGSVSVFAPPGSATDAAAAKAVVALFAQMLVAAGPGVPSHLLALVERGALDLRRLRDELEAALVPLNRSASRRVLSRLVREAGSATAARPTTSPGAPAGAVLDDALDDLLGTPAPPRSINSQLDDLLAQRTSSIPAEPGKGRPGSGPHPFDGAGVPKEVFDRRTPPSGVAAPVDPFGDPATKERPYVPASSPPPGREASKPRPVTGGAIQAPPQPAFGLSDPFAPAGFDEEQPTGEHPSRRPPPPGRPDSTEDVDLDTPGTSLGADTTLPRPAKMPSFEEARVQPPAATPVPPPSAPPAPQLRAERPPSGRISLDGFDESPRKGRPLLWLFLVVATLGALGAGVVALRPDILDRLRGKSDGVDEAIERQRLEHERRQADINAHHAGLFGDLTVRSTPDRAQVLLYIGRAPATIHDLPVGVAQEFIAIADGKAPTRAIVPADATWETTPEGRRFELAVQTSNEDVAEPDIQLGDTRLPHEMGTPGEDLGTVRVITAPVGAKVYQLVGFTPDVHITDVRTDEGIELLIWAEGFRAQHRVVVPSDWRPAPEGEKAADIELTLEARSPPPRHH